MQHRVSDRLTTSVQSIQRCDGLEVHCCGPALLSGPDYPVAALTWTRGKGSPALHRSDKERSVCSSHLAARGWWTYLTGRRMQWYSFILRCSSRDWSVGLVQLQLTWPKRIHCALCYDEIHSIMALKAYIISELHLFLDFTTWLNKLLQCQQSDKYLPSGNTYMH